MTKHHVPVQISDTRDRSRYRYVGENDTMREIRAGAARRPGTSLALLSALGSRSRVCRLPGSAASRLTDKTLNRKHYCGAKKGHRQRFPTMVTKTHASEGQGVGRAGPVRCARFWSWQMTRVKRSRVQALAQPVHSFGSLGAANVTWCTTANQDAASTNASHRPKCSAGRTAGTPKE
jgi:hypothetical protein